jgi:hypothetical protein
VFFSCPLSLCLSLLLCLSLYLSLSNSITSRIIAFSSCFDMCPLSMTLSHLPCIMCCPFTNRMWCCIFSVKIPLAMPTYCSRRQRASSGKKETLQDVKCRLVRELAQRAQQRVWYWQAREEWCNRKPGRVLIIGWDSDETKRAMPTQSSPRQMAPSARQETLADVKCRLVRELVQRTNIAEQTAIAQAIATGTCPKGSAEALWHFSSCVEIPD